MSADDFAVVRVMATEDGVALLEYFQNVFDGMMLEACEAADDVISLRILRRAEGLRWVIETLEKAQEDGRGNANPKPPDVSFSDGGVKRHPF